MTAKFQAQVVGQSNQAATWSVQDNFGTIDSTGLYTARRDASGGPFHVVATSRAVPSAEGSAAVTVLVPQVTIAPATVAPAPRGTQAFTATVKGLVNTNVTWTVQEVGGGSVSNAGFYTAPQATGSYHVVATSVADTTHSGSATITVTTSSAMVARCALFYNGEPESRKTTEYPHENCDLIGEQRPPTQFQRLNRSSYTYSLTRLGVEEHSRTNRRRAELECTCPHYLDLFGPVQNEELSSETLSNARKGADFLPLLDRQNRKPCA